jgi:hypothetical protein
LLATLGRRSHNPTLKRFDLNRNKREWCESHWGVKGVAAMPEDLVVVRGARRHVDSSGSGPDEEKRDNLVKKLCSQLREELLSLEQAEENDLICGSS